MPLLLDTHSFLWFIGGDKRLSTKAREAIADLENEAFLSIGSLWEIAIKLNVGKLKLPRPFGELNPEQLMHNEVRVLYPFFGRRVQARGGVIRTTPCLCWDRLRAQPVAPGCLLGFGLWGVLRLEVVVLLA